MSLNFSLNRVPEGISTSDTTDPTPGNSGTLSTSSVNSGGFSVNYTKATDNESTQANLRYYLYTSTSDNVGTVSNAEGNGTLQNSGGTLDVSTLSASGLSSSTTYYFNIVVEDEAGNKAAYTSNSETTPSSGGSGLDSQAGDEEALQDLYTAANGGSWTTSTGWSSNMGGALDGGSTPHGVTTQLINSEYRVTEIDLSDNNLTGSIDTSTIGNLKEMTSFNVLYNDLSCPFPSNITSCTSLVYLYLNHSDHTTGKVVPHEDAATGGQTVHPGKVSENHNVFSGSIPTSISNLANMEWFVCTWSTMTSLPDELFDCTSLRGLMLHEGSFSDRNIPSTIGNMTNLTHFVNGAESGGDAWWTGSFPSGMSNLTGMVQFWCNRSSLTGSLFDVSGWTQCRHFIVNFNSLSGSIPASLADGTMPDINQVNLDFNSFTGTLPEFSSNTSLTQFNCRNNDLDGIVPASFWNNVTGIKNSDFSNNNFTSIGTTDLTNLFRPRNLRWGNCDVDGEDFPNLNWGTSDLNSYSRFEVQGNKYLFKNMLFVPNNAPGGETCYALHKQEAETTFRVGNQQNFGSGSNYDSGTGVIDFSGIVTHSNNSYQWYKDGSAVSGETSNTIDTDSHGGGDYHLEVTNSQAAEVGTIKSVTITV